MSEKQQEVAEGITLRGAESDQYIAGRRNSKGNNNGVYISSEMFERVFQSPPPQNVELVQRSTKRMQANPTPIGLIGFVLSLTPLAMDMMGWHGATASGAAVVGSYYLIGGVCMTLGGILEYFLGNTFSFVVFVSFGGYYSTYGTILTPSLNTAGSYSATGDAIAGAKTAGYNNAIAFYLLWWAVLTFIYTICSLRTNVVSVLLFLTLDLCIIFEAVEYMYLAENKTSTADTMRVTAGAFGFASTLCGWWEILGQLLIAADFPVDLPMGDLSWFIKGRGERGGSIAGGDESV